MGLLSKKRKVPRIVKKVKTHLNRKFINIRQVDPKVRVSIYSLLHPILALIIERKIRLIIMLFI